MQKKLLFLVQFVLCSLLCLPFRVMAQGEDVILQPQFGKQTVTVATGQELTYYDPMGTASIPGSMSSNAQSLLVFKPAEAGMSVQITFERLELIGSSSSYPAYMNVYYGEADADATFAYATTTSGMTSSNLRLPEGTLAEQLTGTLSAPKTFYSNTPDGAMSVGYLYRYAEDCEGWVAKVKCVKLEDMQVTNAGSSYDHVPSSPRQHTGVALAGVYVNATGVMNADHVMSISYKLTKNEGVTDPANLRLYRGNAAYAAGLTPLSANLSESDGVCTFVLDEALDNGTNWFSIVGDIQSEAAIGAQVQVEVTAVTTKAKPEGVSPFVAGEPRHVSAPAIVLLSAEHQTVTVGDTPLAFYDDGGLDGQVTKGFNGSVTFRPATEGKKVMVDFSKVSIFSGSIYSQYLKVYNGSEATADNLLRELKTGDAVKVRSTAADGSLTVTFESTTSGYTGDGFEAQVSQFEPQPMEVASIVATQDVKGTLCAGDAACPVLCINIQTSNTKPPLSLRKLSFSALGTYPQVSRASVYYTKSSAGFSDKVKVGEAEVSEDNFELTVTEDISFVEGDNFLWLAYDIAPTAMNGQKVDAAVTSVTLSDGDHTVEEGSPAGEYLIRNIVFSHLDQGTVTTRVNGMVEFVQKTKNEYSSDYESGTDDRINIFEPLHEGMVCQIDFTAFNLYWASYGNEHAKLKVYSGKGTTGDVLWEMTSKEQKSQGPERTLRSTSADGAITVLFNSGVTQSWSTASGFQATVSEYLSRNMVVDSLTSLPDARTVASPGATRQDAITLQVVASGNLNAKSLQSATLLLEGNVKDITGVSIYAVDAASSVVPADAEPLSRQDIVVPDGDDNALSGTLPVTLALATPFVLAEGVNSFRVCLDVSPDALSGDSVVVNVQGIEATDTVVNIAASARGNCLCIKNIYNLQAGSNGEIQVADGQPLLFYDDGGAEGDYTQGFDGTVTFAPKTPGESIRLTFKSFGLTYQDNLYLYSGGEVKDTPDAKYSRYDTPDYFVSESEDGKVTVHFVTKMASEGFVIEVTAYRKVPLHVAVVTTQDIAPENVMRGEENVAMIRMDVQVDGELEQLDITQLTMQDGDDIKAGGIKVFTTDTQGTFAPLDLYGEATDDKVAINGSYRVTKPGVYVFWLAYDIDSTAEAGQDVHASLTGIVANGEEVAVDVPATATTQVKSGFHGTLTVGAGADYGTIQAAVNALRDGIDGPVTINIKRGIYNELVEVPAIKGTSSVNTVTIQSESGNYHDVRVYYDQYTEPPYSDDRMSDEYGVFTFSGANWVTLRGLELTTADLTFPGVVHVKNVTRHLTIDSCYIHADKSTSYSNDINLVYTYAKGEANMNNDYLCVTNSLLEGGYIGIRMGGTGIVKLPKERGGRIENNVLRNQGSKAIYCMDELGAKIRGNRIENSDETSSSFYGFDGQVRDLCDDAFVIEGNTFNLNTSKEASAIYLREAHGTQGVPALIVNNEILVTGGNSSCAGIKMSSKSEHTYIAYNTLLMNCDAASSVLYINNEQGEGVHVMNNIMQSRDGGYVYRCYNQDTTPSVHFANNTVYTSGETFAYDKSSYATFEDWKAASSEDGSYNEQVEFLSDEVLEPDHENNLCHALPLAFVDRDIVGNLRDAEHPTMGAYEYDADEAAPQMGEGYPAIANITDESADVFVKANKSASLFALVKPAGEAAPSADDVLASGQMVMVRTNALTGLTLEGLTKDEEYVVYVVLMGLRGTATEVYASEKFVAGGEVIAEIPSVAVVAEATESVEQGQKATLTAYVTSGTAPFSIMWTNGKHVDVASATLDGLGESVVEYAPQECDLYYVTVTDANGKEAKDTCRVIVTGDAVTATFENLHLEQDGFWWGPDTKGHLGQNAWGLDEMQGSFVSGSYSFENRCMAEYDTWGGFAYSRRTSTNFNVLMTDQFNSCVGTGHHGSENYAVAYDGGTIQVLNSPQEGDSIRGFYITNSAYALTAIREGYAMARKFIEGDYLKVTFIGHKADGTQSTLDYYLADYRFANEANRYSLDTWQWVDLRPLGKVTSVTYSISGSDSGSYGLNTPAYFCLDDFNGEREVTVAEVQTDGEEMDLSAFFHFNDATATITYALADELLAELKGSVLLTSDGKLTVKDNTVERFTLTVKAVQKGKIQFVSIPFDMPTTIGRTDAADGDVSAARYNVAGQRMANGQKGISILRSQDGTVRKILVK